MINTAKRRILKGRSAHRATVGVAFAYVTDLITRCAFGYLLTDFLALL